MSVVIPVAGNVEQPVSLKLPDTAVNDVLDMSVDTTGGVRTIVGIVIVNQDSSEQKVSVWWNDGASDLAIYEGKVAANSTVQALDAPLVMYTKVTGRKIKAQAAKADVVTVTVVYTLSNQRAPA